MAKMDTKSDSIIQFDMYNMENICRTCLKQREMQSIYETNKYSKDTTIAEMLEEFNVIQNTKEDKLPHQVCMECAKEITKCYLFLKKCKLSDGILRNCCKIYKKGHQINIYSDTNQDLDVDDEVESEEELSLADSNSLISDSETNENKEIYSDEEPQDNDIANLVIVDIKEDGNSEILEHEKEIQDEELLTENKKSNTSYKCNTCSISFKTDEDLLQHNQTLKHRPMQACDKNVLPFQCEICDHRFKRKMTLQIHMRSHCIEKPFKCSYCVKSFTYYAALKWHLLTRHDKNDKEETEIIDFEYECDICKKAFLEAIQLKIHKVFHGEKKFKCSVCNRKFISEAVLESHLTVHSNERSFKCDDCEKSFTHLTSLTAHKLIHSGEKPYPCSVCDKSFKQSGHLVIHMRKHTGQKPYKCSVCSKSFVTNTNLMYHMRIHTGEKPHACPTCGKAFHNSSNMKKHQRKHGQNKTE